MKAKGRVALFQAPYEMQTGMSHMSSLCKGFSHKLGETEKEEAAF